MRRGAAIILEGARSKRLAAITLASLGLALAACGDDSDGGGSDRTPEETVREYLAANEAADGERLCALYTDDYRELIENESGNSCAEEETRLAKRYDEDENELLSVEGDTATVSCEDSTAFDCSLPLKKEDGEWRIDGGLSPND